MYIWFVLQQPLEINVYDETAGELCKDTVEIICMLFIYSRLSTN
jgi:hypothetical protein